MEIVIVTGLSGAGKSCAIDCFEDMGYYCTDNLPPSLIKDFITLIAQSKSKIKKAVFVVDIRGGEFFDDLFDTIKAFDKKNIEYKILFLDADTDVLIRRFNETRRSHPLAEDGSNTEAIEIERGKLEPLKKIADYVINTSNLKTVELADEIRDIFAGDNRGKEFELVIQSFGFKYGLPKELNTVFDMRFIPNPFYIPELKNLTGNDKEVQDYVMESEEARDFKNTIVDLLLSLIPAFMREGKYTLNVAFGCTGGQHRSVTMANLVYKALKESGINVILKHRDI